MKTVYINKPQHKGYNSAIETQCDYCNITFWEKKSHFHKTKRHFCSMECYSKFRKELLPLTEQHAYKGVRKEGETKQIYHRNYCKKHKQVISHLKSRRYAREKGAVGNHTLYEWNELKHKYGNVCAYCKENKKLTKDHIIPLSKGGTDYISNIQPLCKNCNSKKHNKIIHDNPELIQM